MNIIFEVSVSLIVIMGFIDFVILQSFYSEKLWYVKLKNIWGKILIWVAIVAFGSVISMLIKVLL